MIDYYYIIFILLLLCLWSISLVYAKDFIFRISSVIVLLFIGLRASTIGADTYDYVNFFVGKSLNYNDDIRDIEPLFILYNKFLNLFFKNGTLYILTNTILSLFPILYVIKKYSNDKILSLILFFVLDIYIIYFVALRQILSVSIILLGVISLIENFRFKWLLYIVFSIVAFFMHTTSIFFSFIFLVLFFVPQLKKIYYIIIIILSLFIGLLLKETTYLNLFSFFAISDFNILERVTFYFEDSYASKSISLFNAILSNAIILLYLWKIDEIRLNHWFSKIFIFSIIFENLFRYNIFLLRLEFPFYIFGLIALTWPINRKNLLTKYNIVFFILFFLYVIRYIRSSINPDLLDAASMHMYKFFFQ